MQDFATSFSNVFKGMRLPRGACPEHLEILPLHGVYPEQNEILRYAQNDKKQGFRVRMTGSEGLTMTPFRHCEESQTK